MQYKFLSTILLIMAPKYNELNNDTARSTNQQQAETCRSREYVTTAGRALCGCLVLTIFY